MIKIDDVSERMIFINGDFDFCIVATREIHSKNSICLLFIKVLIIPFHLQFIKFCKSNHLRTFKVCKNKKEKIFHVFDFRLIIYNDPGREVSVLLDQQIKPRTYEVNWDASAYPSSVYFYKMSTVDFTVTNKDGFD